MKTHAVFFPFDLFGAGGTREGVELLADAFQEMLADNKREKVPTRARAYANKVRLEEFSFATLEDYHDWRACGEAAARDVWKRGDFLLWTTGSHLGVLPLLDVLAEQESTLVVQFDAHLDIYNLSDCTSEPSHGNFLLHARRGLPAVINIGHRELLLKEDYVQRYYERVFPAWELAVDPEPALAYLKDRCRQCQRVFFDLDCDFFDVAYFPGVVQAKPFGLSTQLFLRFLESLWCDKVVGLAISEFDPGRDVRDQSLATLAWLMEHVLLKVSDTR